MSAEPKSTSARAASLIGRKLPWLTATALRLLAPVLPNLWLFYSIVESAI